MTENTNNLNPIHIDNFDKPDVTPPQSNINTNPLDFLSNTAVADLQQLEEIQKQPEEEHNQPEDVQEKREAMLEQREEELGKAEEMHEKVEDVLNQSEEPPQLIKQNPKK